MATRTALPCGKSLCYAYGIEADAGAIRAFASSRNAWEKLQQLAEYTAKLSHGQRPPEGD